MVGYTDKHILGPDKAFKVLGVKDKGEHLDDEDLLLGSTDGWDEATAEENQMRFITYVCICLASTVSFLICFLMILLQH